MSLLSVRLVLVALVLALMPSAAFAHAALNRAQPADGSIVEQAPASFRLVFSEPVSPLTLRLTDPTGETLSLGDFTLAGAELDIAAPAALGRGTHVLSWRVVSVDGHPIGGSVIFSIGEASSTAPIVAEPVDWPVRTSLWLSRVALYAGLFFGVGGVAALRLVMPGVMSSRRIIAAALCVGAAGAALSIGFQGLDALGAGLSGIVSGQVWTVGFATSHGTTVLMALVAFLAGFVALNMPGIMGGGIAMISVLAAGLALAASGHASAAQPQSLMRPAVFVHAVAVAIWIGALAPLGLALRRQEPAALDGLRRFSTLIPGFVGALLLSGMVLAFVQARSPDALASTGYGRILLAKIMLLLGLFWLASHNRWTLTDPTLEGKPEAAQRMARSVAIESAIVLIIFALVAGWRFTPPPRVLAAQAALPEQVELVSDKAAVILWVGPGRKGPVDIVANVLSPEFEPVEPKEISLTLSNPEAGIEPFRRVLKRGEGMADWHASGVAIPLAGIWRVRIDVLVTDFEIARVEGEIRIRP